MIIFLPTYMSSDLYVTATDKAVMSCEKLNNKNSFVNNNILINKNKIYAK